MSAPPPDALLDPVAAYDRVASIYEQLCARRTRYLASIESLIVSRVPEGSRSLLDVGAGDGQRALRISAWARLPEVVLLEPSVGMSRNVPSHLLWAMRAEDLDAGGAALRGRSFDVITCLWNVLGHIRPARARSGVLLQLGRLLSPNGVLFVDLTHRYNVRSYGLVRTAVRFLHDRLWPGEHNGDVRVDWSIGAAHCATYGHVFTEREGQQLVAAAELAVAERLVVDYESGVTRRFGLGGNLLYALRRRRR